tara:strand:+ start:232 stop:750 length:519 start_codon:yes stop_codon:yes gene_type:complete
MKIKIIFSCLIINILSIVCAEDSMYTKYPEVEVGIESITQISKDKYTISIYGINPMHDVAGIQFKFIPTDIFTIKSVYGGKTEKNDFEIHFNKNGTILGFSMVGNTLGKAIITSGPTKNSSNIFCFLDVEINDLEKFNNTDFINMEFVLASKDGKSLKPNIIPFNMLEIKTR